MGVSKYQITKSVCLNDKNEDDKKILKHIARRNFSGYVKKLILEDIKQKQLLKEKKQKPQKSEQESKKDLPSHSESVGASVPSRNRKKVVQSVSSSLPLLNLQNKQVKGN